MTIDEWNKKKIVSTSGTRILTIKKVPGCSLVRIRSFWWWMSSPPRSKEGVAATEAEVDAMNTATDAKNVIALRNFILDLEVMCGLFVCRDL